MSNKEELEFAKNLAYKAGEIMRKYFMSDEKEKSWKSDKTPLTIADTKINALVIKEIAKSYPGHSVVGEEASSIKDSEFVWVCDPIDGTTPYSHNIPLATFNLALVHKGNSVLSVVYDPFQDRMFHAMKGEGSFLNSRKLILKDENEGSDSRKTVNIEVWGGSSSSLFLDDKIDIEIRKLIDYRDYVQFYFCSVAYSVVLAASGDISGVVFSGENPWDSAACTLVASEAGLKVTDIYGDTLSDQDKPTRGFIVGTPEVHAQFVEDMEPFFKKSERK